MISPLISIVVPIFNSESTIEMCLESLVHQTYPLLEVILVNDGSTDNTEKLCQKYTENDKRFLYVYKDNGGLSDARNCGLKHVHGEYVMFLDSDDAFSQYCIESMVKIINKSDVDIISFNFSQNVDLIENACSIEFDYKCLKENNILEEYFLKEVAVTNRCFKKDVLDGIDFVKGQISEDVIYLFRCYAKAKRIYIASQAYYFYNQNGLSITRSALSIKDNTSVDANITVLRECELYYQDYVGYARLQYFKSIFNIINKSAIRGYSDQFAKDFYSQKIKEYLKQLRKNYLSIISSKCFSNNDKIQITILCLSKKIFIMIKKMISRR